MKEVYLIFFCFLMEINESELYKNQQKFITAYDIYESLYHIIFGNNYEKQNYESDKRFSIFQYINEKNRTCDNYDEIDNYTCKCFKR